MQVVYCKVKECGFNGKNGFCLKRLTSINERGVCAYLTKPDWNQQIDSKWFNNAEIKEIERGNVNG